jgi:hypothetical protein
VEALIPLAALLAGMMVGCALTLLATSRRRRRTPQPVCGCQHHFAMHSPDTGACHGIVGYPYQVRKKCTCQVYTGPAPIQLTWDGGVALLPPPREDAPRD